MSASHFESDEPRVLDATGVLPDLYASLPVYKPYEAPEVTSDTTSPMRLKQPPWTFQNHETESKATLDPIPFREQTVTANAAVNTAIGTISKVVQSFRPASPVKTETKSAALIDTQRDIDRKKEKIIDQAHGLLYSMRRGMLPEFQENVFSIRSEDVNASYGLSYYESGDPNDHHEIVLSVKPRHEQREHKILLFRSRHTKQSRLPDVLPIADEQVGSILEHLQQLKFAQPCFSHWPSSSELISHAKVPAE